MCLILVAWHAHHEFPLVVAANRDEFHARATAPAAFWADHPQVLAGRDLAAGGTWLGFTCDGRLAALTNFRDPARHQPYAPSRGRLVADFLCGETGIDAYLDSLDSGRYNGFNLLLGDGRRLVAFSNVTGERHELAPGIYGLSNALLDTPWPKVGAGKAALEAALHHLPDEHGLWALLCDDRTHPDHLLPATGVPREWERLLSAAFIRGVDYGTRSSTVITLSAGGKVTFDEQTWLPGGMAGERRRYRYSLISTGV
ncbi:NRDE family protein [Sulfuricystis multivorans]|uniref:NRDE family protein n=1 Tax=Sulfuricystis multivorans TaxID=2211108 RepID=UPI000F84AF09|nr:NRDE family protein [Sulfuricystis multivorans]